MEIVGRHHDPFTVMEQFERPIRVSVYSQPVTDITGALLARMSGAVAAYNWLILLSFPLSAATAYLLARHLALSPAGATFAAMAYAFSPFHLAHAGYHPHVAQTQWMPLYLLALWRCLDAATPASVGLLGASTLAVTLSNFYAGVIAAVLTPVAVAGYWFLIRREGTRSMRRLFVTVGTLLLVVALGMAYAWHGARIVVMNPTDFAFPRADLFRYSAKWWSYLIPPVGNPWLGAHARHLWTAAGVDEGLLEQQVYLGWGIVALGVISISAWLGSDRPRGPYACVPVLVLVAVAGLLCSLSPERTIGEFTFVRPSALLYNLVPMFRSYARFGVVVQLMAALLAGIGVEYLGRTRTRRRKVLSLAFVALAASEYFVAPATLWRDVLPTNAHRWVARQPGRMHALDCMPLNREAESVQWLTRNRVTLGTPTSDCTEPHLPQKLAATGYTHLLVRRDTADGQWFAQHAAREGLRVAASLDDGEVFAVTAQTPAIYTAAMTAFFPREHDAEWSWRWMGAGASWTVVNTRDHTIVATLFLEMAAFHTMRRMELLLDGQHVQTLAIDQSRRTYQFGPITLVPGRHELRFRPSEAPTIASHVIDNGDRRQLSFAFGDWDWTVSDGRP